MSSVVISGDSSGTVSLTVPSVAGTNTATLPAATGTVMVSGNMPAFSAYQNVSQTLASSTFTKLQLQVDEFDTANAFDATTNYRFQPLVAGYYQVNGAVNLVAASGNNFIIAVFKNGSEYKRGNQIGVNAAGNTQPMISILVYLNGSTDYLELYGYQNSGSSQSTGAASALTYFNGSMVRAA